MTRVPIWVYVAALAVIPTAVLWATVVMAAPSYQPDARPASATLTAYPPPLPGPPPGPANQPPVANAGPGQTVLEGSVVTLDGSGSTDPDAADIPNLIFQWAQASGTPLLITGNDTATPSFFAATPGAFTFTLTVTDPGGLVGIATVTVTVRFPLTVNSTGDGGETSTGDGVCDNGTGACTLRAAIEEANASAGTDTIAFNIPGTGPHAIQPASALPTITDPVVIDGYTQTGASPNTNPVTTGSNAVLKIELDGSNAGASSVDGLLITTGSSVVRGLVINRFSPNPPKDTDGRREGSGRGWVRELQGRWPGVLG